MSNVHSINTKVGNSVNKEDKTRGDFFISTTIDLLDDPKYRKLMKGVRTTYDWLRANIVRGDMYNDKLFIKRDFYDKGELALVRSYRQLARELFIHRDTAACHMKKLIGSDVVRQVIIPASRAFDRRVHHVYVLGTWKEYEQNDGKIHHHEYYYINNYYGTVQHGMF